MALGLDRSSVIALLPLLGDQLHVIAQRFVDEFRAQLWKPFADAGLPEDRWPAMLDSIRNLLPVASQAVLAVFRDEFQLDVVPEAGGRLAALESGQADNSIWALNAEDNVTLVDSGDFTVFETMNVATNHFPVNNTHPVLGDKAVRHFMEDDGDDQGHQPGGDGIKSLGHARFMLAESRG